MQDDNRQSPRRRGGWTTGLLIVSLAVNLAVLGFLAGAVMRPGGAGGPLARAPGLDAYGAPYIRALPRQERREILRLSRDSADGEALPDRRERRALYRVVLANLRAAPFDPEALRAAVMRQAEVSVAVQQRMQRAWIEVVANMDDADRTAYADAIEELLRRGLSRR